MKIQEVMSGKVQVADPNQPIHDAARMMAQLDCGAIPVGENDRLVGMITDRDISIRAIAAGSWAAPISSVAPGTKAVIMMPPSAKITSGAMPAAADGASVAEAIDRKSVPPSITPAGLAVMLAMPVGVNINKSSPSIPWR